MLKCLQPSGFSFCPAWLIGSSSLWISSFRSPTQSSTALLLGPDLPFLSDCCGRTRCPSAISTCRYGSSDAPRLLASWLPWEVQTEGSATDSLPRRLRCTPRRSHFAPTVVSAVVVLIEFWSFSEGINTKVDVFITGRNLPLSPGRRPTCIPSCLLTDESSE